jgi:integrase/recombinase XerD
LHNPVHGVEWSQTETGSGEGATPAIANHQARRLLDAPPEDTTKGKRDRAILSVLLFHGLRRQELCKLRVKDARHARKGVPHLKVRGKGGKIRYVPLHPASNGLINDYLDATVAPMTAPDPWLYSVGNLLDHLCEPFCARRNAYRRSARQQQGGGK